MISSFISEGTVGYYYSSLDSLEWKKTRMIVSSKPDFSIVPYLTNKGFDFSSLDYSAAAYFVKYLIDIHGLEKYMNFLKTKDGYAGLANIYGLSIK